MIKLILFPFVFIVDYILIVKYHLDYFIKKSPPKNWVNGNKGDVILLPGIFEHWTFLQHIANKLNTAGYKIHIIDELGFNVGKIETAVELLNNYITQNNLQNISLVCQSKGGLIAKYYIDKYGESNIKNVFCYTVPYFGTVFGFLLFFNLAQLRPVNKIKQGDYKKFINFYTEWDNHILTTKSSILPGAENILINSIGHTWSVRNKKAAEMILHQLQTN